MFSTQLNRRLIMSTVLFLVNLNEVGLKLRNIRSLNACGEQWTILSRSSSILRPRHIPHLAGTVGFEKLFPPMGKNSNKTPRKISLKQNAWGSLTESFPSCAEHDTYGLYLAADPTGAHTEPISTLNYLSISESISTFVSPQLIV